jgi:hypothetical protein
MKNAYRILVGELERQGHSEDIAIDERLISEWIAET